MLWAKPWERMFCRRHWLLGPNQRDHCAAQIRGAVRAYVQQKNPCGTTQPVLSNRFRNVFEIIPVCHNPCIIAHDIRNGEPFCRLFKDPICQTSNTTLRRRMTYVVAQGKQRSCCSNNKKDPQFFNCGPKVDRLRPDIIFLSVNAYFFKATKMSANSSSCVGPAGAGAGAASSAFFILFNV